MPSETGHVTGLCRRVACVTSPLASIIVPAYNEGHTIAEIVACVRAVPLEQLQEIVVVDDASHDNTRARVEKLVGEEVENLCPLRHLVNRGKAAAIRTGVAAARGAIIVDIESRLRPARQSAPARSHSRGPG